MSESSGNTRAINHYNVDGSRDYGLFQVRQNRVCHFVKGISRLNPTHRMLNPHYSALSYTKPLKLTHPKSKKSYQIEIKDIETFS